MYTEHTDRLGFREWPRRRYLDALHRLGALGPAPGPWTLDADLAGNGPAPGHGEG